jgi:hypothetical protein
MRTVWGYGDFGGTTDSFVTSTITTPFPETSGNTFTVSATVNKYIYFCHPKRLGLAKFYFSSTTGTNVPSESEMAGGMDGATWGDGEIGYVYEPITLLRDDGTGTTSEWYLYRSDFINHGNFTIKVNYENA